MTTIIRLVDTGWDRELDTALAADHATIRIICPFLQQKTLARLLRYGTPSSIQVITRFHLGNFCDGVSDLAALRLLMAHGANIRGIRDLHAKVYLFGDAQAIVTSANLTEKALIRNHEFGVVSDDPGIIIRCRQYFDDLWQHAGNDLTPARLEAWVARIPLTAFSGKLGTALSDLAGYLSKLFPTIPGRPIAEYAARRHQYRAKIRLSWEPGYRQRKATEYGVER